MYKLTLLTFLVLCISLKANSQNSFSFDELLNSESNYSLKEDSMINSDGLKIVHFNNNVENPIAQVIFIHGGGANSKLGYEHIAETLAKDYQIEMILIDLAGHGKSEGKRGDCKTKTSNFKDINQLFEKARIDNKQMYLAGHSSGAGLILNYHSWKGKSKFDGYIFISPEFGYKSETAKEIRTPFAKVILSKFIINGISGGTLFNHSYAITLNYPEHLTQENPSIVTQLTVIEANSLTPKNPKKQYSEITEPTAIFIGENDELFAVDKVISYNNLMTNKHKSTKAEIMVGETHLSILLKVGGRIGEFIIENKN